MKRSSKALRAVSTFGVVVSRSTVVLAAYNVQVLRLFLGEIRALSVGSMHSNRLPGSKDVHCAQL